MLRSLFAVCLVLSFSIYAQEIVFSYRPPGKGEVKLETQTSTSTMAISVKIEDKILYKLEQKQTQARKKEEIALESSDNALTSAQVKYLESMHQSKDSITGEHLETEPIKGKSYIVRSDKENLTVSGLQGEKINENEQELIKEDYRLLGSPDPVAEFLRGKTIKTGEKLEVPPEVAQKLFLPQTLVKEFSFTLKEIGKSGRIDIGVFATVLKISEEVSGSTMTMELEGETIIGSDCQTISLKLKGICSLQGEEETDEGKLKITGKGDVCINMDNIYRKGN